MPHPRCRRLGPGELRHQFVVKDGGPSVPDGIALLDPWQEPDVTSGQLWGNQRQCPANGVDRSVAEPGERHLLIVPLAIATVSFPADWATRWTLGPGPVGWHGVFERRVELAKLLEETFDHSATLAPIRQRSFVRRPRNSTPLRWMITSSNGFDTDPLTPTPPRHALSTFDRHSVRVLRVPLYGCSDRLHRLLEILASIWGGHPGRKRCCVLKGVVGSISKPMCPPAHQAQRNEERQREWRRNSDKERPVRTGRHLGSIAPRTSAPAIRQ